MNRELDWSPDAIDAYEELYEYLRDLSPRAAERFAEEVLETVSRIWQFPELGRVIPEYQNVRFREVIVYPYRVLYRLHADGVTIETIVHGSVNLRA